MTRERFLRYAAVGAGVLVVLGVGTAAFISLQVPFEAPGSGIGSAPCSPAPCASIRGYIVWITDLKVDSGLVSMQVTFSNASPATHADPADLQLIDSQKQQTKAVYDAPGCTHWPRTEFNNGAKFGPVPECFRPQTTSPPLILRWSPDMGLFCCDTNITLE